MTMHDLKWWSGLTGVGVSGDEVLKRGFVDHSCGDTIRDHRHQGPLSPETVIIYGPMLHGGFSLAMQ